MIVLRGTLRTASETLVRGGDMDYKLDKNAQQKWNRYCVEEEAAALKRQAIKTGLIGGTALAAVIICFDILLGG